MFISIEEIIGYQLDAEKPFGKVKNLLLDDQTWRVRYFAADTGGWLSGRQVLISPMSVGTPNWVRHTLPTDLSTEQIEKSPGIEEHMPVSRKFESDYYNYFGYAPYWTPMGMGYPPPVMMTPSEESGEKQNTSSVEPHLRSYKEMKGYTIKAADGEIGHVEEMIVQYNNGDWKALYIVVDTRNWLPGKKVMLETGWIENVDWVERTMSFNLQRETIKNSPEYKPDEPVSQYYIEVLYDYYGRPVS